MITPTEFYKNQEENITSTAQELFTHIGCRIYKKTPSKNGKIYIYLGSFDNSITKPIINALKPLMKEKGWNFKISKALHPFLVGHSPSIDMFDKYIKMWPIEPPPTYSMPKKRFFSLGRMFTLSIVGVLGYYAPHFFDFIHRVLLYGMIHLHK